MGALEDRMRISVLIGACLFGLAASAVSAPPIPTPRPKSGIVPPPAAAPEPQAAPTQSAANNLFPFKFPGFGSSGTTTNFDAKQGGLIERVNVYLRSEER